MAEQQGANATMGHDDDVANSGRHGNGALDRSNNPPLRVDGTLPTAYAYFGRAKECVGHRLEFGAWQIAGRGPVILTEFRYYLSGQLQVFCEHVRALYRLTLAATEDGGHAGKP